MDSNQVLSKILRLNWRDIVKGLGAAVLIAGLQVVLEALKAGGIDALATIDWASVLDTAIKAAAGFLSIAVLSNEQGKMFGKI